MHCLRKYPRLVLCMSAVLACLSCADSADEFSDGLSDKSSAYLGAWLGNDAKDAKCEVRVHAYNEVVDAKIERTEAELNAKKLTGLRRIVEISSSMQKEADAIFEVVSVFDQAELAYTEGLLQGELEDETTTLNIGDQPLELRLQRGTETLVCSRLHREGQSPPNDSSKDPPKPVEPFPRGKGRPRY